MEIRRAIPLGDAAAFAAAQGDLGRLVRLEPGPADPGLVAAVDVAYSTEGPDRAYAVAVLIDAATGAVREQATWAGPAPHPYVPGLFALREAASLINALQQLSEAPDLLFVDGQGIAHPRRFGVACLLGLTFDVPTVGVAKRRLHGDFDALGEAAGSRSPLRDADGTELGAVLRTQDGVRPVFVSPGHRCDVQSAADLAFRFRSPHRIIAPLREADIRTRVLRDGV